MVRYPHIIQIKTSTGEVIGGIFSPRTGIIVDTNCLIQQKTKNYKDGKNEDSNVAHWIIFCSIFQDSDEVGIGDKIIPVKGLTEFDMKSEHKILSYIIYQNHIEIEV